MGLFNTRPAPVELHDSRATEHDVQHGEQQRKELDDEMGKENEREQATTEDPVLWYPTPAQVVDSKGQIRDVLCQNGMCEDDLARGDRYLLQLHGTTCVLCDLCVRLPIARHIERIRSSLE